jgi:hypothetical protein
MPTTPLPLQVEAYFQGQGMLGVPVASGAPAGSYWIGASRQFNASLLTSQAAAGKRFYTGTGTKLPFYAPSNGPSEGPQYAAYAHWGVSMFAAGRMYGYGGAPGSPGDCVLANLQYS